MGVIMLAIDHKVPKVMTLKQMIQKYVEFQDEVAVSYTHLDVYKRQDYYRAFKKSPPHYLYRGESRGALPDESGPRGG